MAKKDSEFDFESLLEEENGSNLGECTHCDKRAVIDAGDFGNLCEDCYEEYVGE